MARAAANASTSDMSFLVRWCFTFDSPLSEEPRCQTSAPDRRNSRSSKDVATGVADEWGKPLRPSGEFHSGGGARQAGSVRMRSCAAEVR